MKNNSVNCSSDDYDFYSISLPVKVLLHQQKNRYISGQLEKLHPCFSDDCSFDSHLRLEKTGLKADVVVMQKYKIAEYKALHKRLFVKERQNIHFFSNKTFVPFCISIVIIVILFFVFFSKFFQNKKQAKILTDNNQKKLLSDFSVNTEVQHFFAPELLNQISELKGFVSDFVWTYDGYNESVSVLIKGLYPEQLDFGSQNLQFSSVSFEKSIPCFSVSCENKINQISVIEIQNLSNQKNDFRKNLLKNNIFKNIRICGMNAIRIQSK